MDKVADLLIRIKNGYMASNKEVALKYSKLGLSITELLKREGYIENYQTDNSRVITVNLKYNNRQPALTDVTRISKPGRRIYTGHKLLPRVLNGLGLAIISTPKGVMSDKDARKSGLGGEVMAYVW